MRLKKNVFGYINFSIGTLIMSVFLYTLFVSLFKSFEEKAGKRILFMGIKLSYINAALLFIVSLALIFLLFFIKSKITVKPFKGAGLAYGVVYWCFFAGFLSYGFFVRLINMGVLRKWGTIKNYTESVSKPGYWQVLIDLFYGKDVTYDNFFARLPIALAIYTPLALAWDRPLVMPAPSPAANRLGIFVSRCSSKSSREL